jgi:hypothetical protein
MGQYEDSFYQIYQKAEKKGVLKEFKEELSIVTGSEENKHKPFKELWEITYNKVLKKKNGH